MPSLARSPLSRLDSIQTGTAILQVFGGMRSAFDGLIWSKSAEVRPSYPTSRSGSVNFGQHRQCFIDSSGRGVEHTRTSLPDRVHRPVRRRPIEQAFLGHVRVLQHGFAMLFEIRRGSLMNMASPPPAATSSFAAPLCEDLELVDQERVPYVWAVSLFDARACWVRAFAGDLDYCDPLLENRTPVTPLISASARDSACASLLRASQARASGGERRSCVSACWRRHRVETCLVCVDTYLAYRLKSWASSRPPHGGPCPWLEAALEEATDLRHRHGRRERTGLVHGPASVVGRRRRWTDPPERVACHTAAAVATFHGLSSAPGAVASPIKLRASVCDIVRHALGSASVEDGGCCASTHVERWLSPELQSRDAPAVAADSWADPSPWLAMLVAGWALARATCWSEPLTCALARQHAACALHHARSRRAGCMCACCLA